MHAGWKVANIVEFRNHFDELFGGLDIHSCSILAESSSFRHVAASSFLPVEPSPGQLSGDAELLPIRQFDQRIGLTRAFAEALDDPRDPEWNAGKKKRRRA